MSHNMNAILVGVDGSDAATGAVRWAARAAAAEGLDLKVVGDVCRSTQPLCALSAACTYTLCLTILTPESTELCDCRFTQLGLGLQGGHHEISQLHKGQGLSGSRFAQVF